MKNNRKNRKLKFIKEKNALRLGFTKFYCIEKRSVGIELIDEKINELIIIAKKLLLKKYKISLPTTKIESGFINDDFVKDFITYKIILSLK